MPWKRRANVGRDCSRALNIADLREIARRRVPGFAFEYVEGGAEDEATLRRNREAFSALRFVPQTLVDTSGRSLGTSVFGRPCAAPLAIAPTGLNGMLHPDGDMALARAAAGFGIPYTLSTLSTTRLEDVAAKAGGRLWMQLYVMKNRAIAENIMARAAAAGYEALVFTSDANVFGSREWDKRNYARPGKLRLAAILDSMRHPRWLTEVLLRKGIPQFHNIAAFLPPGAASAVGGSTIVPQMFEPTIAWADIDWMRRHWPGKLLVKGVLSVDDALRAADAGCDGIVLTNHGGRQLDYCVAAHRGAARDRRSGRQPADDRHRQRLSPRKRYREGTRLGRPHRDDRTRSPLRARRRRRARRAARPRHARRRARSRPRSARLPLRRRFTTFAAASDDRLGRQHAFCFRGVRGHRVHQRRRETVIGLEAELLQASAHLTHPRGREPGLDDGRDERGEVRRRPALLAEELRMHEVEPVERVILVLDPAVHVHAAARAGVALDRGVGVDDLQLLRARGHGDLVARQHRHQREERPLRLPALAAAADVAVCDVASTVPRPRRARAL